MTRQILPLIATVVLFITACSPKFQATVSEDKPLFSAINTLNKKPGNAKAQNDIKILFGNTVARHEEAIAVYKNGANEDRFDKVITELNALQNIYNSVQAVPGASALVKPKNYLQELETAKNEAAEYYYGKGQDLMKDENRVSDLQAYESFKTANRYVSGYKNVQQLIDDAWDYATINVVINPIEDDNIFFAGYTTDYRYRPQDFEESLVRELGGVNANIVPARFYTYNDARRENIDADWSVDARWRNIDVNPSIPSQYSREVSKQVQIGKDTSGKAVYQTVKATLQITQRTINVNGGLDYRINDLVNNTMVDQGLLTDYVSWTEAYASYRGDSRALSQEDWNLVNANRSFNRPGKADILNTLMRKIYPNLRYRIQHSVY